MQWPSPSVGAVIAIIVVVLATLGVFGVLPAREQIIFGLIALVAASRLC